MFKEIFWNRKFLWNVLIIFSIVIFFYFFFLTILSINEMGYSAMEISLFFVLFLFSYINLNTYSNRKILKRLDFAEKRKLQLLIFFKLIVYGIITIIFSLFIVWFIDNFVKDSNINFWLTPHGNIRWNSGLLYEYFFYFSILELFLILSFWYFINYIFKSRIFILMIFFVVTIYSLFLGNIIWSFLRYVNVSTGEVLGLHFTINRRLNTLTNFVLFPWILVGAKGKNIFLDFTTWNDFLPNYFSNINLNLTYNYSMIYQSVDFLPYLIMATYFLIIFLVSTFGHRNNNH